MIPTMNDWAEKWLTVMWAVVWQLALVAAIATLIAWLLRRSSPVVRYWLWQIVAVKLLLMPFWTFAIPLPSWAEKKPPEQSASFLPPEHLGEQRLEAGIAAPYLIDGRPQAPRTHRTPRLSGRRWPRLAGKRGFCRSGASWCSGRSFGFRGNGCGWPDY